MSDPNEGQPETPVEPPAEQPIPQPPPPPEPQSPGGTNTGPLPPVMKPDQTTNAPSPSRTVGGAHDLEGHPALEGGTILNVGDTVLGRDPNAPSFRRPPLEEPAPAQQSEGERTTTTEAPAKKASRGRSKGEGAGPES